MTLQEKIQACKDQATAVLDSNIPFLSKVEFSIKDISWEEFSELDEKILAERFRCVDHVAVILFADRYQINIHTVPLRIKETVTIEVLETA